MRVIYRYCTMYAPKKEPFKPRDALIQFQTVTAYPRHNKYLFAEGAESIINGGKSPPKVYIRSRKVLSMMLKRVHSARTKETSIVAFVIPI